MPFLAKPTPILLIAFALAACVGGLSDGLDPAAEGFPGKADCPGCAALESGDWAQHGRDAHHTRYTPTELSPSDLTLEQELPIPIEHDLYSQSGTTGSPMVDEGSVYVVGAGGNSVLHAFDAVTTTG